MAPPEHKEKAPETDKRPEFKAEADFDGSKEWNQQILKIIESAMGERYQHHMNAEILTYITTGKDYKAFQEHMADITKMRLDAGTLSFFDKEGKVIASFDIAQGMKEIIQIAKEHDCDICRRRSRRLRQYEFRNTSYADMLRQIYDGTDASGRRRLNRPPPPLSPEEVAANARLQELFRGRKAGREMILATAENMDDEEYDILAHVSPTIQDDNQEEFESHWRSMDFSNEIDDLFNEDPNPAEGYQVNPFNLSPEKKWNHEKLRELIQGSGFWNRNDRLYFKEIAEVIYTDDTALKDLKANLEKAGVPKVATDLLEGDDLQKDYKKLKKMSAELDDMKDPKDVPEKYKNIWPHREKLKAIIQVLGDYIAYGTRLVNYVNQLRYNPAKEAEDRARLMTEFEIGPDGWIVNNPSNRVKESLHELFLYDVESPRTYSSEVFHWFGLKAWSFKPETPITFQDLNGQTATVKGEWFTEYQSPETAYKLAFEQIQKQKRNDDGTWTEVIEDQDAITHINDLIQLGISAYAAIPDHRSPKEIIDGLEKAGVEVSPGVPLHFTGRLDTDLENLRTALSIRALGDLKKNSTEAQKLAAKERLQFVRLGSVIYQKNTFKNQEREQQEREREKQTLTIITLSAEEADVIVEQLRRTKKFNDERLAEIKQTLIGGVGVVLGERPGAGLFLKYELGDGWSIDFTAGGFKGGAFVGAGVGKKFEVKEDIDVSVHAGPGYMFAGDLGGPMIGAGVSVTKKFSAVNVSLETGVGVLFSSAMGPVPSIPIGVGLDWGKEKEKFQETVSKKQLEAKISEVDATGDPYEEVKRNPSKYPQLAKILYPIQSLDIDEASKKDTFASAYELFKTGLRSEAIDESMPRWYERFIPTGAKLGVVLVGGIIPVPYVALEFNLWSRKLLYRVASPVSRAQEISEAQATEAILKHVQDVKNVESKTLRTTKEIVLDPKTGIPMLKAESSGSLDFKEFGHLNRFQQLRDALSQDAKIFVDPADIEGQNMGLVLLSPQEAHGNIEVYIDPELKDDVVLVTRGSKLYLSVKKDRAVYFKREDLTYPFQERGATEKTTITISGNPHLKTEVVKDASGWYMDRTPTSEWVRRPAVSDQTPEGREKQKQGNLMASFGDYQKWWGAEGRSDRLEFTSLEGLHESYDRLNAAVTFKTETETGHLRLRPEVQEKINTLVKGSEENPQRDAFIQEFRRLSTEGFDMGKITATWHTNFPELTKFITDQIGQGELSHDELNAAMLAFLSASFLNIQQKGDEKAKAKFVDALKKFETKILTSVFNDYYKDKIPDSAQRDKKVQEAVAWIIEQLQNVDITAKGDPGEAGMLFATTVGMGGFTGLRRMINYFEGKDPKWGIVGKRVLDPKRTDTAGEVADFWLQTLSPYTPGIQNNEIPNPDAKPEEYLKYQDQMFDQLHSPLVLKLVPLAGVMLTPVEMDELSKIYEGARRTAPVLISKNNIGAVKKLLDWCDKVRGAELNGEKEVKLDENFKIVLADIKVFMGVYKECGNITGLMREQFALVHEGSRKIYFAGIGEALIDVYSDYDRVDFKAMAGLAVPIPRAQRVAARTSTPGRPPEKPETPPSEGETTPTPTIPTAEPLPTPEPKPGAGVGQTSGGGTGQEGSTTGGGDTSGSSGTSSGGESSAGV